MPHVWRESLKCGLGIPDGLRFLKYHKLAWSHHRKLLCGSHDCVDIRVTAVIHVVIEILIGLVHCKCLQILHYEIDKISLLPHQDIHRRDVTLADFGDYLAYVLLSHRIFC